MPPNRRALVLAIVAIGCGRTTLGLFDLGPSGGATSASGGSDGSNGMGGRGSPKKGSGGSVSSSAGFAGEFTGDVGGAPGGGLPNVAAGGGEATAGMGGDSLGGFGGGGGASGAAGTAGEGGSGGAPGPLHVTSVSLGFHHSCALLSDGTVRCWGHAAWGELGYVNTTVIGDDELPSSVGSVDVGGKVVQIAVGGYQSCALLEGGTVRCWGINADGRCGYPNIGNVGDDETPASVGDVAVGGKVLSIAVGGYHTCALLEGGKVRCWGYGDVGALGYGNHETIGDDETPAQAGDVNVGGVVKQLTSGMFHTCALLQNGKVRCWGWNYKGSLGYGNTNPIGDDETPASVGDVNVGGTVSKIAAGFYHTCALLAGGKVRCWGDAELGALGYGNVNNIGDNETPASAGDVDVGGTVVRIEAGGYRTCVGLDTQAIRCWGYGVEGQLGYGNSNDIGDDETPASAGDIDIGGAVARFDLGGYHTCAVLKGGGVRCFGEGNWGALGYGNTDEIGDNETPASAGDVEVF